MYCPRYGDNGDELAWGLRNIQILGALDGKSVDPQCCNTEPFTCEFDHMDPSYANPYAVGEGYKNYFKWIGETPIEYPKGSNQMYYCSADYSPGVSLVVALTSQKWWTLHPNYVPPTIEGELPSPYRLFHSLNPTLNLPDPCDACSNVIKYDENRKFCEDDCVVTKSAWVSYSGYCSSETKCLNKGRASLEASNCVSEMEPRCCVNAFDFAVSTKDDKYSKSEMAPIFEFYGTGAELLLYSVDEGALPSANEGEKTYRIPTPDDFGQVDTNKGVTIYATSDDGWLIGSVKVDGESMNLNAECNGGPCEMPGFWLEKLNLGNLGNVIDTYPRVGNFDSFSDWILHPEHEPRKVLTPYGDCVDRYGRIGDCRLQEGCTGSNESFQKWTEGEPKSRCSMFPYQLGSECCVLDSSQKPLYAPCEADGDCESGLCDFSLLDLKIDSTDPFFSSPQELSGPIARRTKICLKPAPVIPELEAVEFDGNKFGCVKAALLAFIDQLENPIDAFTEFEMPEYFDSEFIVETCESISILAGPIGPAWSKTVRRIYGQCFGINNNEIAWVTYIGTAAAHKLFWAGGSFSMAYAFDHLDQEYCISTVCNLLPGAFGFSAGNTVILGIGLGGGVEKLKGTTEGFYGDFVKGAFSCMTGGGMIFLELSVGASVSEKISFALGNQKCTTYIEGELESSNEE
mmetsp:Transcript_30756/g.62342  ORF Transcript_30756/g.62342 Transcript_30756/m.62342 type:complete len:685 (+) Transcript_30756:2099-4153(+)